MTRGSGLLPVEVPQWLTSQKYFGTFVEFLAFMLAGGFIYPPIATSKRRRVITADTSAMELRKSGYSASGATAQGVRLLAMASVQAEIALLTTPSLRSALWRTRLLSELRG